MSIDDILDVLDEMVDKSWGLPGGRCVMDADKIREIIDDIRLNMPQEMRQARAIVADRSEIIKNAKSEAEGIIKSAEEKARIIVSQDEVVKQAQAKSIAIVTEAQNKSKDIKKAAADFADSLMKHTEESLSNSLGEVKQARQALKAPIKL